MSESIKVLLIDDQPDFLATMVFWMKKKEYDVTACSEPVKAIEMIRVQPFDVAFVDYKMPEMTGLDLIERVRVFNKTLPVILVAAHADSAIMRENQAKNLNISGFFSKIGDFDGLEEVLEVVLRGIRRSKGEKA